MQQGFAEKHREKKLQYSWPVWFAENFDGILAQGQMVEIFSGGAAFTCRADGELRQGEHITARFSVPRYGVNNSFGMENYVRQGRICQVDRISPNVRRIAMEFSEPLPFKPAQDDQAQQTTSLPVPL